MLDTGKKLNSINDKSQSLYNFQFLLCIYRDPTPDHSVLLPQWKTTKKYPLDYLRIGNVEDTSKPIIGMEKGLLEDRATFWNLLGAHLSANSIVKYEL